MGFERWRALMQALGLAEHRDMFESLALAYSEPHRHYHTAAHINACLHELDTHRALAQRPAEVEAALWFHDFVYKPRASDNERCSADAARKFFEKGGLTREAIERIEAHIMVTEHQTTPEDADSALVVDIDLSILGQGEAAYDRFEKQVRAEYRWVPMFVYRRKRCAVLRSFLARPHIYAHAGLRDRYEAQARSNVARAIAQLA